MKKKDYTHIKFVLNSAIFTYVVRGGEMSHRMTRNRAPCFVYKTDFYNIQQPSGTISDRFYVLHHMREFRRDQQNLRMSPRSGDAHILQWAKNLGDIPVQRLRAEFYHIQRELSQIIMKEVLEKTRMFYEEGQMSREDVRTRVAAQRLDKKPFTTLGDYLPDLHGWHDMFE